MRNNKYSPYKIVGFPEKLASLTEGRVTAPIYVRVKPINRCNHDCFFCVYAKDWRKRSRVDVGRELAQTSVDPTRETRVLPKGLSLIEEHIESHMHEQMVESDVMPTAKMMEVLDDFREMGVKAVTYSGGGEPLLYKDIVAVMERTVEYGIDLSIITNGQLLKGDRAAILAKAKWVRVSIDYTSAEQMVASRHVPERMFGEVLDNLKVFSRIKNPECDLGVNYIVHRTNCENLVPFAETLKACGVDNVRFSPMWVPNFLEYHEPIRESVSRQLKEAQRLVDDRFTVNSTYDLSAEAHSPERKYTRCPFMQIVPVVGADQNVYACHNKAYDATGCVGSIKDKRFKELWFSPETKHFFDTLNPQCVCRHQCANDKKNLIIHELTNMSRDNFV